MRPLRPNPMGWFHVMNRGSRRWNIFLDDEDRLCFLQLLSQLPERFEVDVLAYCLLGNHYHLVLHCRSPALSDAMHWLGLRYATRFNKRRDFDGSLCRSRFKSVEIKDDEQLLTTVRYVHRNPLDLDPDADLAAQPWCSHGAYLGWTHKPRWLSTEPVLGSFNGNTEKFRAFVEKPAVGDKVRGSRESVRPSSLHVHPSQGVVGASEAEVLRATAAALDVSVARLSLRQSERCGVAREVSLLLALDFVMLPPDALVDSFGFGSKGALRTALWRARKRLRSDEELATALEKAKVALGQGV